MASFTTTSIEPILVILILAIVFIPCVASTEGNSMTYTLVEVSAARFTTSIPSETISCLSDVICASRALTRPWAHILCQVEGTCHLYDLKVLPWHKDLTGDSQQCYRRPHPICEYNGQFLVEGELASDRLQCLWFICQNGTMVETNSPQSPCNDATFTCIPAVGCIRIIGGSTWTLSQPLCPAINAHLAVPLDLTAFHNYMLTRPLGWYWIGITNRNWDDGRAIPANLYDTSVTTGCGAYFNSLGSSPPYFFKDQVCSYSGTLVCQED